MLKFDSQKTTIELRYGASPVFNITKVFFITDDVNWTKRLAGANITVRIFCRNDEGEILGTNERPLSLGSLINPYSKQAILETNQFYAFPKEFVDRGIANSKNWLITLTLNNLSLSDSERVELETMDSTYILKRIDDFKKRVRNLIKQLGMWAEEENLTIKPGRKIQMHEGMMKAFDVPMQEMESADIYRAGKIIATIKPFGLWLMGANGRVDILSANGNYIIVDTSKPFGTPAWRLFTKEDREKGAELTKSSLAKIIG